MIKAGFYEITDADARHLNDVIPGGCYYAGERVAREATYSGGLYAGYLVIDRGGLDSGSVPVNRHVADSYDNF